MKYVLSFCIFTAFFINYAHCYCASTCGADYANALKTFEVTAQICPIMKTFLTCLEQTCQVDLSQYYAQLQNDMKTLGVYCDLNAASRSVSLSLLTVCGSALLTAYRIFIM